MARKKVEPIDITGLGEEEKLSVQKSLPLFSLWRSHITLPEFKILDTYLARINSHDPKKKTVVFGKGELEEKLGVKRIETPVLKKRLHNLMMPIEVEDNGVNQFTTITLFEEAQASIDENGLWTVKLTCTDSAIKYVFNIDHLGYLRYKLRCITSITSRYSYILFLYLEQNRYRKSWSVDVNELKAVLNCTEESYNKFKVFNDRILKRCQKELTEKSECKFTYEPVKKGRFVVAVRFTVETLADADVIDIDDIPGQISFGDLQNDPVEFLRSVSNDVDGKPEWTRAQAEEIYSLVTAVPEEKLPEAETDDIELRRYQFLRQLWLRMQRNAESKPIRNRFNYFLKMLKQEP